MPPLISVIIPIYNTEQYLHACLESVCAQTLQDIEIICVDDGSTDGSPAILKQFAERDSRIRLISQKNAGRVSARNRGIQAAAGQWIGFVDSDDTVLPDMYERLLKNGEDRQADISHCGMMFCYPDGHKVPHYGSGICKLQDHDAGLVDLLDGGQIEPSMCCKLYRRALFRDFPVERNISTNEDFYYNFHLFNESSLAVYEDFCGYCYQCRHKNFQSTETLLEILSVKYKLIGMSPSPIKEAAYRLWLSSLVNTLNLLSVSQQKTAADLYDICRKRLREEAENISILNKKQQIAARLHLEFPLLARSIYRIYGKYSLYQYEH